MTETQELINYIVKQRQDCTVTEILKICYLLDLGFFSENKEKITDYNYIRYNYGPFDSRIYKDIEFLIKEKYLEVKSYLMSYGEEIRKYNTTNLKETSNLLSKDKLDFVGGMLQELINFNAGQLTEIAYKTKPMKRLGATLGGTENFGNLIEFDG